MQYSVVYKRKGLAVILAMQYGVGTRGRAMIISRDSAQCIGTIIHTYDMC